MNSKGSLTSSGLKIIAIVTMLIDHIGLVLFPELFILRLIGRLAFPIFAFLLVEGFFHTKDVKKYMVRLGMYALISEVPFDLARKGVVFDISGQNIFFTLFLGLAMIVVFDRYKDSMPIKAWGFLIVTTVLSAFLMTDYNILGMATIFLFYRYHDDAKQALISVAGLHIIMGLLNGGFPGDFVAIKANQALAALAMPLIGQYNGERGLKLQYTFYLFYPLHLLLLVGINQLFF